MKNNIERSSDTAELRALHSHHSRLCLLLLSLHFDAMNERIKLEGFVLQCHLGTFVYLPYYFDIVISLNEMRIKGGRMIASMKN